MTAASLWFGLFGWLALCFVVLGAAALLGRRA